VREPKKKGWGGVKGLFFFFYLLCVSKGWGLKGGEGHYIEEKIVALKRNIIKKKSNARGAYVYTCIPLISST